MKCGYRLWNEALFVLCLMQSKGIWQYIMYKTCISIRFTFSTPCHCFWSALTTMLAQTKKNCLWMRSPTSLSNAQLVRQLKWLTLKECGGGWYETDHADAMMVVWGKFFHKWGKPLSQSTILSLKGSPPQKKFYCWNLIFGIVMVCGIARFGRRGLKIN